MELLSTRRDISWLPPGATVRHFRDETLRLANLVTSVFGFCFDGENLLCVRHRDRDWDLPGGHVEEGESFVTTLKRETAEEAAAELRDINPFGYIEISLAGPPPAGYRYPAPQSFMLCFIAQVERLNPFDGKFETFERKFFSPEEAIELKVIQAHRALYDGALAEIRKKKNF